MKERLMIMQNKLQLKKTDLFKWKNIASALTVFSKSQFYIRFVIISNKNIIQSAQRKLPTVDLDKNWF